MLFRSGFGIEGSRSSTGSSVGATQTDAPKKVVKKYIAVSDTRVWKDKAGRTMPGNLLAFDDGGAETAKRPLTLIRDGAVRLLKTGATEPMLVSLQALVPEDQAFIAAIDQTNRQAAPKPTAPEKAP